MMSLQARQYLAQSSSYSPLRWYGPNSPRARGRLVAVAMLADGQLTTAEMREISAGAAARMIGLERVQFMEVLFDLCEDIEKQLLPNGRTLLDQRIVDQFLSEISDPSIQRSTLNALRAVVACDGDIHPAEADFFGCAAEAWGSAESKRKVGMASYYARWRSCEG